MANSKRRCPNCKEYNKPEEGLLLKGRLYCNLECAVSYGKKNAPKAKVKQEKDDRARLRQRKQSLKTRSQWLNDAQVWVNKYIRLRDKGLPCISCGRVMNEGGYIGAGGVHAGHYRSRGACPELRFHEDNIHAQCAQCNNEKSGNQIMYRKGLIRKIGLERVEWIEGKHDAKKYSIDEIKEIIAKYKILCNDIKNK